MKIQMLVSIGFAAHALLGNLCMMPKAFAQGMATPHKEHMEMIMTPAFPMAQSLASHVGRDRSVASDVPMSLVHCEHCAKVQQSSDGDQSQQQSGCAGHCFSQARSTTTNTASFNVPHIVAASLISITVALAPQTTSVVAPPATAPPLSIHINTIVLRL
ncbi:MAG TPA: hypothetical protein VI873_04525 [Candidatus Peribacteraceae bacterium]|nr:hypothetical protein [Candidatus Peribacteraceae bacterium]